MVPLTLQQCLAAHHACSQPAMAFDDRLKVDRLELVVFHHHSPFHDQGFHPGGGAQQERGEALPGSAVTHVAEIEQGDVRALAGRETANVVAAKAAGASRVAMRSASVTPSAEAPCARRLSNKAWRASASMWELSLEALPSTPSPPASRRGAAPEPGRCRNPVAYWNWGNARSPRGRGPGA